jgi:ribose-phosphate pyrophosphokinase
MGDGNIRILSGTAGLPLSKAVCEKLKIDLSDALIGRHNDGEVKVKVEDSVRGDDVYIINPTQPPLENAMEIVLLSKSIRSSAKSVTIVIPYLGYDRSDKKDGPRTAIAAQVMADFLMLSEADRVILFDIHSEATMGYFRCKRVERLYTSYVLIPFVRKIIDERTSVAAPDAGGVSRTKGYGRRLGVNDFVVVLKERIEAGKVAKEKAIIIGDVRGRNVVIIDDIIDTGGSIISAAEKMKELGAERIFVCAAHGIFSKNAVDDLKKAPIEMIVVTDSIPRDKGFFPEDSNVVVVPIAELVAETIKRIHGDLSLSSLFIEEDHKKEEELTEMLGKCPYYIVPEKEGEHPMCSARKNGGPHPCVVKSKKDLNRCSDYRNAV